MWLLKWAAAAVFGTVLGASSALWMAGLTPFNLPGAFQDVDVQGWVSDWTIGSEAADPYTRARVARHGLLALTKAEAVYFIRNESDDGGALTETCDYQMSGGQFPAEWWSITLYDSQSRLPMNEDDALSIDATRIGDAGDWSVRISAERPDEGLWISSQNAGDFDVMLRIYRPSAALIDDPEATLSPPSIRRLTCDGAGE